jgi:hypothetical protein
MNISTDDLNIIARWLNERKYRNSEHLLSGEFSDENLDGILREGIAKVDPVGVSAVPSRLGPILHARQPAVVFYEP